ncbi:squalene/phytoene synthase family protein [Qipengyuania sp. G39]|uniref:Squalene/phytoene synthase family protein n=1 Tax=Qipengyuania profundimaris TaxID=3067652 RepID=A0ABT9HQ57_9SPHN|nr:squalene/phytoene synthase family protein [Qipengyuania sp. G39]MDP4575288.1 squalene/phytoene synthase family protein [Qipengyuania sp. G39]
MTVEDLPPEAQVAIGYASPEHRGAFAALLAFDRNLARSVAGASEAIVGQLRLAWWRDAMAESADDLPRGNPLLDALADGFGEQRQHLGALVDGWESVLLAEPIDRLAIQALKTGREAGWLALGTALGAGADDTAVRLAAGRWALADLLSGLPQEDRTPEIIADAQASLGQPAPLPLGMRPLAVLDALARRSLAAGGAPLLAGRRSAMVALRAGVFGR